MSLRELVTRVAVIVTTALAVVGVALLIFRHADFLLVLFAAVLLAIVLDGFARFRDRNSNRPPDGKRRVGRGFVRGGDQTSGEPEVDGGGEPRDSREPQTGWMWEGVAVMLRWASGGESVTRARRSGSSAQPSKSSGTD